MHFVVVWRDRASPREGGDQVVNLGKIGKLASGHGRAFTRGSFLVGFGLKVELMQHK